jgi:hypothetical protein
MQELITTIGEVKSTRVMLPENTLRALKFNAVRKGKSLRGVHNDAVMKFITIRHASKEIEYIVPRWARENVTIWLPADVMEDVRHYANEDGVSVTIVIFNAFLSYCRTEGIPLDET